jgi:hypothetical protein
MRGSSSDAVFASPFKYVTSSYVQCSSEAGSNFIRLRGYCSITTARCILGLSESGRS